MCSTNAEKKTLIPLFFLFKKKNYAIYSSAVHKRRDELDQNDTSNQKTLLQPSSHSQGCTVYSWENKIQWETETGREQRITCNCKTNPSSMYPDQGGSAAEVQQQLCVHFLSYLLHYVIGSQVNDWHFPCASWQTVTRLLVVWLENTTFKRVIWTLDRNPSGLSNPVLSLRNLFQIRAPEHILGRWSVKSSKRFLSKPSLYLTIILFVMSITDLRTT